MTRIAFILSLLFAFSISFGTESALLENWQNTMKYGISSQRSAVIKAIEDNKATDAYHLIKEALVDDPNPEIRGIACYSLINLKINDETLWNKSLSDEKDTEVLRKVVFGVSELKIKSAGPKVFSILNDHIKDSKQSALCSSAIRSLGSIDYKPASDTILGLLTNIEMTPDIRGSAAIALGELGSSKYLPVLKEILENIGEVNEVRTYSAYAIGKSGDDKALEILSPYIENEKEDLNIRLWSISGLAYIHSPEVPKMLIRFSKVDNIRIRLEAVKSLGKLKSAEATEILKYKAIYDPDLGIRREAKTALQNLGVDVEKLVQEASKPKTDKPVKSTPAVSTNTAPAVKTETVTSNTVKTQAVQTNSVKTEPAKTDTNSQKK